MPGRKYISGSGYRYGFNWKENDNDVKGEGNQQDYGFRVYDPRLGKFLSVDPITKQYPELTPYQFASNTPIENIDLDGAERLNYRLSFNSSGELIAQLQTATDIIEEVTVKGKDGKSRVEIRVNSKQEYTINGRRSNLATVERLNSRGNNTAIVRAGLGKIEEDFKKFKGVFPEGYYEDFGKFLINTEIEILKPTAIHEASAISQGFDDIKNLLDNENNFNNGEGSPLFHAFESIVRRNDNMGYDKLMHFSFSAQHAYSKGAEVSWFLGRVKEFIKDEVVSWFNDDAGWEDRDIEANDKGIKFGQWWRNYFKEHYGLEATKKN